MNTFQVNVIKSFKKAKEDMVRIETTLQYLMKEQQGLTSAMKKLAEAQAVTEEKIRQLAK